MKLFRNNIDPRCAYCTKGQQVNERDVLCVKKGIVLPEQHCAAFRYDPMKRVPPRPASLQSERLKDSDFSL